MWSQKAYRKYQRAKNLREAIKNQKKRAWLNKKTERQVQIIVILFFIGILLTGIYGVETLLTWNQIIRIYLTLAFILSFLPLKFLPIIYKIQRELKLLLTICGLSPFILGAALTINYLSANYNRTEVYKIQKYSTYYIERYINVELENNTLKKHKELRKFSTDEFNFIPDSAAYEVYTGIFSINVIKKSYLIKQ